MFQIGSPKFLASVIVAVTMATLSPISLEVAAQVRKDRKQANSSSPVVVMQLAEPSGLTQGRKFMKLGQPKKAEQYYLQATKQTDNNRFLSFSYNGICAARIDLQRFRKALEACNKAIELSPNRWQAYNNKGNAYYHMGRLRFAIEAYEKGREIRPGSWELKKNLKLAQDRLEALTGG